MESKNKFKYSEFNNNPNLSLLLREIKQKLVDIIGDLFSNKESVLYKAHYKVESHSFILLINQYLHSQVNKIAIPNKNANIDFVLITYLILILEITKDRLIFKDLIRFVIIMREYLNICGWEYKAYLHDFGLVNKFYPIGDYTSLNNAEEIPELFNDFFNCFL